MAQKYRKNQKSLFFYKKTVILYLVFQPKTHNSKLTTDMKAFVNDTEVRTYYGAKVKSVVLAYCRANNLPLRLEGITVKDAYGNIVDLDGALRANSRIYVKF